MKKILAILLLAGTLAFSGCSALGTIASMAPDLLGQSSASATPFPSTVQSPLPSHAASPSAKNYVSALPSATPKSATSPSPSPSPSTKQSSTDLTPGDVIQTVQGKLPIGIQFLIDQIGSLFNMLTGQSGQPSH